MRKLLQVWILLLLTTGFADAQSRSYGKRDSYTLTHMGGLSYFNSLTDEGYINGPCITYTPRFIFYEPSNHSSISLESNLTLGYILLKETKEIYDPGVLYYELPIYFNINIGHGATSFSRKRIGGFVGVGYGISNLKNVSVDFADEVSTTGITHGLYANLGTRFRIKHVTFQIGGYSHLGFNHVLTIGGRALVGFLL